MSNAKLGLSLALIAAGACVTGGDFPVEIEATRQVASPLTSATYILRGLGGKCMTVSGAGAQGDRLVLSTCTATAPQRFQIVRWTGDQYELRAFGMCVDVPGASFQNGNQLQLWPCNGTSAQRFDIRGDVVRPKTSTGFTVEVKGGFTTDGTPIQLYGRNYTASQSWRFVPVGVTPNPNTSVSLSTPWIPVCGADQVAQWQSAAVDREGAWVQDPVNHDIGFAYAKRNDTYRPMSGKKETFCGRLFKFKFQEDNWYEWSDDNDWNIHIEPWRAPFVDLKNRYGGSARSTLEAEIFADNRYYRSSPWFNVDSMRTPLLGRDICAYGPWVNDKGHENANATGCDAGTACGPKLEIHPSEFLWWRDTLPSYTESPSRVVSTEYLSFLHMQDNSGDFDDVDNFGGTSGSRAGWEPWSNSPLRGVVKIPWRWSLRGGSTEVRIVEDLAANVVTAAADQTTAAEQTLAIDGQIVLRVSEHTASDGHLGVSLSQDVCRRPDSNDVLGFVSIRDDIGGNDDADNEGTHAFFVAKSTITTPVTWTGTFVAPRL